MGLLDQIQPKLLFEYRPAGAAERGAPPAPARARLAISALGGVKSGAGLDLFKQAHRLLDRFIAPYGAHEVAGSAFIEDAALARTRYPESFPELLVGLALPSGQRAGYAAPAACHHVYQALLARQLGENRYFDITSPCTRNESRILPECGRFRHFTMRELVFVGDEASCLEAKKRIYADHLRFCQEVLGIGFRVRTASDPFFGSDASLKRAAQVAEERKLEFLVDLPGELGEMAFASLNDHGSLFADNFEIKRAGERLASFCLAWGLERLMLALIDQGKLDLPGAHE